MSMLISATMFLSGTVGALAKYCEPNKPFSSPVTATNKMLRLGRRFSCFAMSAISISDAMPEPSSIAPL